MQTTRLFERLTKPNEAHHSKQAMLQSIENHILELLSVRQGTSQTRPEIGVPDFNVQYMTPSDTDIYICQQIKRMIEVSEPRISRVMVERLSSNSPFILCFSISCNANYQGEKIFFQFNTTIKRNS